MYTKKAGDPNTWIPKEQLEEGAWYKGKCRNNSVAWYVGGKFHYLRYKFGNVFAEELPCPEDDQGFDVFFAQEKI